MSRKISQKSKKYPENNFENKWIFSRWRKVDNDSMACFSRHHVEGLQEALLYSVYAVYLMGYRDTLASTVCPLLLLNRFRTAFSSI